MDLNDNTKEFWMGIKPNDIISLQDAQEIEGQMEEGKTVGETDYTVTSVNTVEVEGDNGILAIYRFLNIETEEDALLLMAKIVDNDIALRIYFKIDKFEPGDRYEVVERGDSWLFNEPDDPTNFKFEELSYADVIERVIDEEEVTFYQVPPGELYGTSKTDPPPSGLTDIFLTLVEYCTDSDLQNPYILALEEECIKSSSEDAGCQCCESDGDDVYEEDLTEEHSLIISGIGYDDYGDVDDDEEDEDDDYDNGGGVITLYLGADLSPGDVNAYRMTKK